MIFLINYNLNISLQKNWGQNTYQKGQTQLKRKYDDLYIRILHTEKEILRDGDHRSLEYKK